MHKLSLHDMSALRTHLPMQFKPEMQLQFGLKPESGAVEMWILSRLLIRIVNKCSINTDKCVNKHEMQESNKITNCK